MGTRTLLNTGIAAALALTFGACGSSGGGGTTTPTSPSTGGTGTVAATITISSTGVVSPKEVTIAPGSRVTFVNNDSRNHEMASDPHPEHTLCPSINSVGFLSTGQSRTSANLNTPGVCTYHDHLNDANANLKGTIRVQ
jgi:plastocyanin